MILGLVSDLLPKCKYINIVFMNKTLLLLALAALLLIPKEKKSVLPPITDEG